MYDVSSLIYPLVYSNLMWIYLINDWPDSTPATFTLSSVLLRLPKFLWGLPLSPFVTFWILVSIASGKETKITLHFVRLGVFSSYSFRQGNVTNATG